MDELIEWCEKQIKFLEETAGIDDNRADMEKFVETAQALRELQSLRQENERLRELVSHCWVHSGYENCGYVQMDTPLKVLYEEITEADHD